MPAADIEIRPAAEADLDIAGGLCVAAYTEAGHLDPSDPYVATLRDARARFEQAELLVAVRGGAIVGTVTICPPDSPFAEVGREGELEFRFLAVAPKAWRTGVGEGLVAACEQRARSAAAVRLVICVVAANAAAHRLYLRLGFERLPERDWQPRPGISLWAYRRSVPWVA
jgi:GNAT superfamily N-acetyltransferase